MNKWVTSMKKVGLHFSHYYFSMSLQGFYTADAQTTHVWANKGKKADDGNPTIKRYLVSILVLFRFGVKAHCLQIYNIQPHYFDCGSYQESH